MQRAVAGKAVVSAALRAAKAVVAVGVVPGLLLAWPGVPAQATAASARPLLASARSAASLESFHLTSGNANSNRQHVTATGTLTATGYALAGDFASSRAVTRLVFRHGRLRLVTKANQISASVPNPSTCKFTEEFSGDYVIRGGTGRYGNASGSGTYASSISGKLKKARGGGCSSRLASFYQSTTTQGSLHR
jgi:hypothetical protein